MPSLNLLAVAAAAVGLSAGALAQDAAPLSGLAACRLDGDSVALRFTYEGGTCEEPGEPAVEGSAVTVPTLRTAEICTTQIVPVEFSGTIAMDEAQTVVDVAVLTPDGAPWASGSTEIQASGSDCEEAAEPAAQTSAPDQSAAPVPRARSERPGS